MQLPPVQDRPGWFFLNYLVPNTLTMRNILWLAILSFLLASCGGTALRRKLSSADSLVITFDKAGGKTVSTTESKAIRKLAGFIDGKKITKPACEYDGNITFYREGKLIVAAIFNYTTDSCRHFYFDADNTVSATRMNNEATDFLRSLAEGKTGY